MAELYITALEGAAKAAKTLTKSLKSTASGAGWDSDIVSGMSVEFSDDKYKIELNDEKALTLEYGTETIRPAFVMRKTTENTDLTSPIVAAEIMKSLGVN